MLQFTNIVDKLKELTGEKQDIQIAKLLKADSAKFAQWKKRNTIPIQELVSYCNDNDVDFNYIFKDNYKLDDLNDKNSDNDKTQFEKELLEATNKLTQKKQQYFYHMIMAEGFREE